MNCEDCPHYADNPHFGECGDMMTGYCLKHDKPVERLDAACEDGKATP